jgi:hypothetical protein
MVVLAQDATKRTQPGPKDSFGQRLSGNKALTGLQLRMQDRLHPPSVTSLKVC